ncbi:hypothetical protein HGM15179_017600 [Zosterops borbonicus]|uniref:Uncharacterized protein n=1 Tax=Zosterops borbonicus TaxID=364589 RepID=A0A8K1G0R4_9PASS|nr:hypothetical protein HGM15179_017600 [Zosterops borbonicus]
MPEGGCDPVESLCWSRVLTAPVDIWRGAHAGAGLLAGLVKLQGSHVGSSLFLKDCTLWKGPALEQGKSVRSPPPEEEGPAETMCDKLAATSISCPPTPLEEEIEKIVSNIKLRKEGELASFKLWIEKGLLKDEIFCVFFSKLGETALGRIPQVPNCCHSPKQGPPPPASQSSTLLVPSQGEKTMSCPSPDTLLLPAPVISCCEEGEVLLSETSPFENVHFCLDVKDIMFLLLILLTLFYMAYNTFRIRAEISRVVAQRSAPVVENPEWHGMREDIGQVLKKISAPIVWNFAPEQIQNPAEVGKYLKENRNGNFNEGQLIALCWVLANAYPTLLDTIQQHLQPEGKENKSEDTMVTQSAVKPEGQPKPIAVASIQKRKYKTKSIHLMDYDGEAGPSQGAEESEPEIITESSSL